MNKGRIEAFSDGVIAIIITIMVLELKVPHEGSFAALLELAPVFLSYVLSFIYVGIYWNNHHHLFQLVKQVRGPVLWANLHLLFWLSILPFVTAWSGENHFTAEPVALYGFVLFMCSIAYYILARTLLSYHGKDSELGRALGSDVKGKLSTALYAIAMLLTLWSAPVAMAIYILVALIWLIPDRRVEKVLEK